MIRRVRRDYPNAVLAVCGCYTQHAADKLEGLGIDVIGGSSQRLEFLEKVLEAVETRESATVLDAALRRRSFEVLPAGGLDGRTRAMLKVQDGCVNFCSYCIIPYTRGPVRSAPLELAVEQVKELAAEGFREIIVTGIEIASWGVDLPGKPPVADLIEAVCAAVPELRVRLGSLEPRIVTEEFCRRMAKLTNLCPQFHLSMQSGCDTVLERMKRKYDTARYLESVKLLNATFPGCAVTTDMIVAFPGETEEEFQESLSFIRQCGFADMHIFPYSRRPGTPADKMPGQHPNAVKEARSKEAIAVAEEYVKAGCEYLQVSSGMSSLETVAPFRDEKVTDIQSLGAYFKDHFAGRVPVSCVGGLTEPEQIHYLIEKEYVDTVDVAKAILADPEFANAVVEGKPYTKCFGCRMCQYGPFTPHKCPAEMKRLKENA